MKKLIYHSSIMLLFANAIAACLGGLGLIIDPSGEQMGLSLNRLRFLPFRNYLVPGLLLFVFIGIGSLLVAMLLIKKRKAAPVLLIVEGVILGCWLIVQSLTIPTSILQFIFGGMATVFIINGLALSNSPLITGKDNVKQPAGQ